MKYGLLCLDLDGTLLTSKKQVSRNTAEAIRQAQKRGVHVAISTGRIYENARHYALEAGFDASVIASDGAVIRLAGEDGFLSLQAMGKETIARLIEICRENGVYVNFNTADGLYCRSLFYYIMLKHVLKTFTRAGAGRLDVRYYGSDSRYRRALDALGGKIVRAEVILPDAKKVERLRGELRKFDGIELVSSFGRNIEITRRGVSKGRAVEALARHLGLGREQVIAIGDGGNDLSMVEYAGLGVAMENASEALRQKADYVTASNNEEGVAKVIERYILSGEGQPVPA